MNFWQVLTLIGILASLVASSHAVLHKRDHRALAGWVGVIWLAPFSGSLLYLMFGINRIERRGQALRRGDLPNDPPEPESAVVAKHRTTNDAIPSQLEGLAHLVGEVTSLPLLSGNNVDVLVDGDEVYPRMVEEIDSAQHSVALATYIFDADQAGELLLNALQRAVERGVAVRLLIDDVGARYSWPSVLKRARRAKIPVASFLPVLLPRLAIFANLRNHRKILVVDGRIGFAGGINIREEHYQSVDSNRAIQDLHFRFAGPVVAHLQHVFLKDWHFATGELLAGEGWCPAMTSCGNTFARGIADGPDEDMDKLHNVILAAIGSAHSSIAVVTPYFLPNLQIIDALCIAAMRGVTVDVIVPQRTNILLVQWASMFPLQRILEAGCRVWRSAPPFDHSKLMIVDGQWSLLGSANWDPRSLRLNFEFNVECYDQTLTKSLQAIVEKKIANSRECTIADFERLGLAVRLRDGVARMLTPYL